MRKNGLILAIAATMTIAACGGGDGDNVNDAFDGIGQASGDVNPNGQDSSGDQGSSGGVEVGPVTQTADPGTGWVEVDGERYEFTGFGSTYFTCELAEDHITVNFQQTQEGNDFGIQGGVVNGQWNASLTFAPGNSDTQVSYGASLGVDDGTLGIGDQEISYEGTMDRVENFDLQNAQAVQGKVAVNCASPGGDPTAEIDGQTFTFPINGAGSLDCLVSNELVQILISHSQPEYLQLQVDIQDNGGELFGAAYVTSGDDNYISYVPSDGAGVAIDGASLDYEGTFTAPSGDDVPGSVSVTCG